jgi:hypothetical protein
LIRHLADAVVETEVGKIGTSVGPDGGVDDYIILAV